MKKRILAIILLCVLFLVMGTGCRKIASPTGPVATYTPDTQGTAGAIVTAISNINATQTQVAAVNTALAIVTMIGQAHATETATAALGTANAVMTHYQQTINATITPSATPTLTATQAATSALTMSPTTVIPPEYNCHIRGYLPQASYGKQFVITAAILGGESEPIVFYGITNGTYIEAFINLIDQGNYWVGAGVDNDNSGYVMNSENPLTMYTCGDYQGLTNVYYDGNEVSKNFNLSTTAGTCITPSATPTINVNDQDSDGYETAEDCDDTNADVHPGAEEICDGLDNDCDGETDEDVIDGPQWFRDADGDGFGNQADSIIACEQPAGYTDIIGDCDDSNADINPGAEEICDGQDNNCNGEADELTTGIETGGPRFYRDADNDGYGNPNDSGCFCENGQYIMPPGYVENNTDCDDSQSSVHPGAEEICDGLDNDCDGEADEDTGYTWYRDMDEDGYGNENDIVISCEQPQGYTDQGADCDDERPDVNPGMPEVCDGRDNDCDGETDEEGGNTWYLDADGDTKGNPAVSITACTQPEGYVDNDQDCDDADAEINPSTVWYYDNDGDGYGSDGVIMVQCMWPGYGYIRQGGDCNDADGTINPDTVWYKDLDNDNFGDPTRTYTGCNPPDSTWELTAGDCDDMDPAVNPNTFWYRDADNDGYGNGAIRLVQCTKPVGYVANFDDCDDSDASKNPEAVWYYDYDGDGYGVESMYDVGCYVGALYRATEPGDCDDNNAQIHPETVWYQDMDADGYGNDSYFVVQCSGPAEHTLTPGDCDDQEPNINPGAPEIPANGEDDDCDGETD